MELPREFVRRMERLPGNLLPRLEEAYRQPLRRGLRINTLKAEPERLEALFSQALTPTPFSPLCRYLTAPLKAGSDPLHHAGAYYMQEPSAATAVTVLAPRPGEKILDLCAAPGGKSTQIAAALGHTGLLWCNEYVPARAKILRQNLERCGVRQAAVSNSDTARLAQALPGYFDAILVDAPCSGEGMFRKEPQALEAWSVDNIRLCAARQDGILDAAAQMLRPGGRLVYSTCTFAPEENELAVARFLLRHGEFSLEPITVDWGSPGFPADGLTAFGATPDMEADLTGCRRIFPHQGGEGHFIARLRKAADAPGGCPPPYTPPKQDPHREEARALYESCFTDAPEGSFVTVGDTVRLLPPVLPALPGTGTLAAGIAVAQVCKNRLEPCHAAFAAARSVHCRRLISFSPEDARLTAFLHGEELATDTENGFTAVAVADIPLGFGKCSGGRLKNRYPKGLRLL